MKKIFNILLYLAISSSVFSQDIYFSENFEDASLPADWTHEYVNKNLDWKINDGGYSSEPAIPGTGDPPYAYQGNYNAYFQFSTLYNEKTKFITPAVDLDYAIKPELRFWHAMDTRYFFGEDRSEELKIYYKVATDSSWKLLKSYLLPVSDWTERKIYLPDSVLTSTFYIAFEGKNSGGAGVCIDSVTIVETGIIPKYLESLEIKQTTTEIVPTESNKNAILRIDLSVQGNDGSIKLDSLAVNSLNTDDNDIVSQGVKLYAADDTLFRYSTLIAVGGNFSNGLVIFDNINYELLRGLSSVWITYDIAEDVNHQMEGHVLDAKINANAIKINNYTFPLVDKSPVGYRTITEALFFDDFETDMGWVLTGEFERATPQGLGGSIGYSDPENATSGLYIIGTDLTGLGSKSGDYENTLPDHAYQAISPLLNAKYYRNINIIFWRWLNMDGSDHAYLDLSTDGGTDWINIWNNPSFVSDNNWVKYTYDISNYANDKDNVKVQFALGTTDNSGVFSGWNIDDFAVTGNFLTVDAGITDILAPNTGCGHSASDSVTVVIKNYAGLATNDTIPVYISFDEGTTKSYDTIFISLPVDGIDTITLSRTVDLSAPGEYNLLVSTALPNDEVLDNNSYTHNFYAIPTLTLPYSQNFESNNGHWRSLGLGSWEYGQPTTGNINTAASGQYAWVTKIDAEYPSCDSSILESPCFDFSAIDNPVFEFKIKGSTTEGDGMALYYSTDTGKTWVIVPETPDYYWEWYNKSNIYALNTAGWDTISADWYSVRKLLPAAISDEPLVKFRFLFKSDAGAINEGFGIDDIKIYETPADVGVTSLIYPYDRCEWSDTTHVKVYVENYGIDTLEIGSKIPIGLDFKNEYVFTDTMILSSRLFPGDSLLYELDTVVDMSYAGDYNIDVYTLLEADPYFYNDTVCNDSISKIVTVKGIPGYNPFEDIIGTSAPIDYDLDAGAGYAEYLWQDASSNDTLNVTTEGTYKVTVTNANGCTATDTTYVLGSVIDLALDSIHTELKDSCERFELTEIIAIISNNGPGSFSAGDSIYMAYQINENPIVIDTLFLANALTLTPPNDTAWFTFREKCDLKSPGEYKVKVFTNFKYDLNHNDDTLTTTVHTKGFVDIDLAYDTIFSSQADTLELIVSPVATYSSYLWNTTEDNDTISPTTNTTQWYVITASDDFVCGDDSDSTHVITHDFGISAVNYPTDTCENDVLAPVNINVDLANYSANTYASAETVNIFYNYDNTGWLNVTPELGSNLLANDTISLDIGNIDISTPGNHTLKIYTSSDIDANHSNDTIEYSFNTWEIPDVVLAFDTIQTTKADTVVLVAQDGFATYNWSDGITTNDSLEVTDLTSQNYVVTVTDVNGCSSDKDSTFIMTYNIGIQSLVSPISNCEHTDAEIVTIAIKNHGADIIPDTESFEVYYILDNGTPVPETINLSSDLNPGATITHQFTPTVDLSSAEQTYVFTVYTNYNKDVYRVNDTLTEGVRTYGNPVVELGNDVSTSQPDTVLFIATSGYNNYTWNEGTKNDTLEVSFPASKLYSVTVTDINGCNTSDSVSIFTYDVGISSINTPTTTCEFSGTEILNVSVLNNSQDTLLTDETINLSYSLNGGTAVNGVLTLTSDLLPDSTVDYSFTATLDLTSASNHNIEVSCALVNDVNTTNDTLSVDINEVGYPSFTLGNDIETTNPVGTVLTTTPGGFDSYLWQDGSTGSTFTITYTASAQYSVTVADSYGCETPDTLEVYTYNVAADSLATPIDQCELSSTETVKIGVINTSEDTLQIGEALDVGFILNSGSFVSEAFTLTEILYPDSLEFFTLGATADLSVNQLHEFKLFAKLTNIDVLLNDTATASVDFQKPEFDLGENITVTVSQDTIIDAGEGFASYLWFNDSTDQTYTVDINEQTPNHYYTVTVTNDKGCEASDSIMVTFDITQDLGVTALLSPESECWQSEKTYQVQITIQNLGAINISSGTPVNIGYRIDNGTPVIEDTILNSALNAGNTFDYTFANEITFDAANVYEFKPFVKLSGDEDVDNDTLLVGGDINISQPDIDLGSDTVKFTESTYEIIITETYTSYEWSTGETTSSIVISETGTYSVTVTDDLGCQGSDSIYCEKLTGIDYLIKGDGYTITYYPNPVTDELRLEIVNSKSKDLYVDLINIQGQVIYNKKYSKTQNTIERIDVNPYAKGVYYIRFRIDDEFYIRKIIIQ